MTLFSADKADDIVGAINCEVSEMTVHITWLEPSAPNGMIILYEVNYKRLGDSEVKKHTHLYLYTFLSCLYFSHVCSDLSHWVTEFMGSQ